MPFQPVEARQHGIASLRGIPQQEYVGGVKPLRLHAAVQALEVPAALLRVPGKGLIIYAYPLGFDVLAAPGGNRIGVVLNPQLAVQRALPGRITKSIALDRHHEQSADHLQIVALRQRLGGGKVTVRPQLSGRGEGVHCDCDKRLPHSFPAVSRVYDQLHLIAIHGGNAAHRAVLHGQEVAVPQALIAQTQEELLRERINPILPRCGPGEVLRALRQRGVRRQCECLNLNIHASHSTCGRNRGVTVIHLSRNALRLAAVAGVLLTAWLADSAVAMHTEHSVAQEAKESSRLETTPNVYVGGVPFTAAALRKEIPYLEVNSSDVEVPRLGMVNASTTLRDITIQPEQLFSGDLEGAPVSTYTRSISLDGVALGRLLGITDLSIANPDDMSPAGGPSAEAELTGTLPGDTHKSTATVTLRLVGPEFRMSVYGTDDERLKKAFGLVLDTRSLPLPSQATSVKLLGGSISFEVQRRNITLKTTQLSPLEIDGSEEQAVLDAEQKAQDTANEVGSAPTTPPSWKQNRQQN